jgi:hypothetical protein
MLWFQQDGTTAHTAEISIQALSTLSPGRLITRFGNITWSARSPDHAVPDYFLWGYVGSEVYETRPAYIAYLKRRIWSLFKGSPSHCYNVL